MTRQELANLLLADKNKLNEEVVWLDDDTVQYYCVGEIKTETLEVLPNGRIEELKAFKYLRENGTVESKFTVIR